MNNTPLYRSMYEKLFQGIPPTQINRGDNNEQFWFKLLLLDVDREFLEQKLNSVSKEDCLGYLKPALNGLFAASLLHAPTKVYNDPRKHNAFLTLSIVVRSVLVKNLTGWEVMEAFAGGVSRSDRIFGELTAVVHDGICDENAPAEFRHLALQLALIFMCGVGQLSPGAYFLQRDLFPALVKFIKSPATQHFTFEAVLLLGVLTNFHKSDAAKLNPYLKRIKDTTNDDELMRTISWATNFAVDAAVKGYQEISDDSPPTITTTLGSMFTSFRPDRVLASTPVDPPRELFKNQPIEASVVLLPIYEFVRINTSFSKVLQDLLKEEQDDKTNKNRLLPLPCNVITLSSYLFTHASSLSSQRAIAYANLSLHILLQFVKSGDMMAALCTPIQCRIRLCRQRPPVLPLESLPRPPMCSLLDCCVLWLRHNLHKRLESASYSTCLRICYRVVWYLQTCRLRIEYEWQILWSAILGLLHFIASKLDALVTTGGVEQLIHEAIILLDLCLCKADSFLPSPSSIHEFIYELVRSSEVLKKQAGLLQTLSLPQSPSASKRTNSSWDSEQPVEILARILTVTEFYEEKVQFARAYSAADGMRVISREIEANGLHMVSDHQTVEQLSIRSEDVLGFSRFACSDGLALMP